MKRKSKFQFERLEPRAMLSVSGDFNGDGFDDLAIGAPQENVFGVDNAGAVHVLYGGINRLSSTGNQRWTQQSSGIDGVAYEDEQFGEALAVGDFDDDGFDDLAIGVVGEAVNGELYAGAVNIIYGSPQGLRASGDQLWTQDSSGVNGVAKLSDRFGHSLIAGDFDNDGIDDLAIGVVSDKVADFGSAGSVNVLYGTSAGLSSTGDQLWNRDTAGIDGVPDGSDTFGYALAAGDFNNDGRDDLAIGAPGAYVSGVNIGSVNVIYGGNSGLTASGDQLWHQNVAGVSGTAEGSDRFGEALTAGKFNSDNFDDLAIGSPGSNVGGDNDAGEVNVLYGSASKIQTTNQRLFTRDSLGAQAQAVENFGRSLAAGDFDGNGIDDLVIGAPIADLSGHYHVGYVQIVYGLGTGLSESGTRLISQDSTGILDTNEELDNFGFSLVTGDYNNDGFADVAIGAPGQDVGGLDGAGQVAVLYGLSVGLTGADDQIWNAGSIGILGSFETDARFGGSVA